MGVALSDSGSTLTIAASGIELCRYEYRPDMPPEHAPRPYLHPIRTLDGLVVTDAQPDDHPWHYGLSVAVPLAGGSSFWGGPTYERNHGYVPMNNHGRVDHEEWTDVRAEAGQAILRQRLTWRGHDGAAVFWEHRELVVRLGDGRWDLDVRFRLEDATGRGVSIGSPATAGRAGAGYGGLFLRAAPRFRGGPVRDADGRLDESAFGQAAGSLTMSCGESSLTMTADAAAHEPWFFRRDEYPGMGPALAFERPLVVAAGGAITRAHRLTVACGPLTEIR